MWRHGNVCVSGMWPVTRTHHIMQRWEICETLTSPGSWHGCSVCVCVCVWNVLLQHIRNLCVAAQLVASEENAHTVKKYVPLNSKELPVTCTRVLKKKQFQLQLIKSTFKTDFLQCISVVLLYKLKRLVCVCFLLIWNAPAVVWSVWYFPADYACCERSHDICVTSASEWNWLQHNPSFSRATQSLIAGFWSSVLRVLFVAPCIKNH